MAGKSQALLLDFYEPLGDKLEERPLVIIAHGGSFLTGDRSQTVEFCVDFAKRGYVCANIEYRLLDMLPVYLQVQLWPVMLLFWIHWITFPNICKPSSTSMVVLRETAVKIRNIHPK